MAKIAGVTTKKKMPKGTWQKKGLTPKKIRMQLAGSNQLA
jgi:hypothetical protein